MLVEHALPVLRPAAAGLWWLDEHARRVQRRKERREAPSVIEFLDPNMPRLNGAETVRSAVVITLR